MKVKEIFCIEKNNVTYRLTRIKLTWLFNIIYNDFSKKDKKYYLQISNKNPYLIPKKVEYEEGYTLFGWLFLYFGCDTILLKNRRK